MFSHFGKTHPSVAAKVQHLVNRDEDEAFLFECRPFLREALGTDEVCFVSVPFAEEIPLYSDLLPGFISSWTSYRAQDDKFVCSQNMKVYRHRALDIRMVQGLRSAEAVWIRSEDREKLVDWIETLDPNKNLPTGDPFEDVQWTEESSAIRRDTEFWLKNESWFKTRRLPYARSYLLYGPPGNGKSATVQAIARKLRAEAEVFDFSANYSNPDSAFREWATKEVSYGGRAHKRCLVLEDLDRYFAKGEPVMHRISFSAILNAFDGADRRQHSILIATANHPEWLDENVLVRPGRFNLRIEYRNPTLEEAETFLRRLFQSDPISSTTIMQIAKRCAGHSYAFLKDLLTTSASIANFRSPGASISDEDASEAVNLHLNDRRVEQLKSTTRKTGF